MSLELEFEWDTAKNNANQAKHRISFEMATKAFVDPFAIVKPDAEHSTYEARYLLLGFTGKQLVVVSYVERHERIRIISCRLANMLERRSYERHNRR